MIVKSRIAFFNDFSNAWINNDVVIFNNYKVSIRFKFYFCNTITTFPYKLTKREKEKIKYSNKNELKQEILNRYPRTDRLIKTVNNSDTPYSYTQKTRKAPRFDNY